MIDNRDAAIEIACRYINDRFADAGRLVVVSESIIEKEYGWVMFYNTEAYLNTGDVRHALSGNGPLIVEKMSGAVVPLGAAEGVDAAIERYEAEASRSRRR